ncbi:hypothetical protein SAMN03159443_03949 [Pseudomonas sp. NFACC15-1]|uniref:hypothetical protein n=1 Tax=unclassified Pseudomonas TaxID=196821 RepID=UPI000887C3C1|nr:MULTISPECIES: hypothetical protein [unclassified Pseudomonas]SDA87172.1 hypothetical protein SAMN03159443_03949 [Pseudomonas sp. NFACC15-1]SDY78357.1 hypothetical protein SAMN03159380_04699 [Pseudomonas sp. NFACC14]
MTTYSLNELTNRMNGKSVTLGWDAVVFMNRAKVNSLLEQQYITRFNRDSFLKRIFGAPSMVPDDSEYLEMSGLILSHPRLSFEKASLRNSRATATMDIVSGTVSYVRKGSGQVPGAILYSYVVSVNQGYTLTMDIDLTASRGTVNEQGRVIVDIGDGYNCRCNLVNEDRAQETLGNFFKSLFLEQKPEDRIYELGMLDLRDVDLLAPRSFLIRTMATDEGKNRASDDYGEGAVVVFVRTKGNPNEGGDPNELAVDYLIPNDRHPTTGKALYSGSLILASRVVFDWYVREAIERQIGGNLRLRASDSNHLARKLSAVAGGFDLPGFEIVLGEDLTSKTTLRNHGPLSFNLADPDPDKALQVFSNDENNLEVALQGGRLLPMHYRHWVWLIEDQNRYWDAIATATVKLTFAPVFSSQLNYVTFESDAESIVRFNGDWDPEEFLVKFSDRFKIFERLDAHLRPSFLDILKVFRSLDLPGLNVLAISNLLFPERNALQLTEARLPGDLLMVGHIDPKETTFTLDPLLPVIKAGDKQTFEIRQLSYRHSNVQWSVRSVDGSRALGVISNNGEYEAPDVHLLDGSAIRNVVTATYTDPDTGKEVTASALVVVVLTSVVVTPSMSLIPMSDRRDVRLKATSLGAGPFRWTPRSNVGSLQVNGAEAVYTPPSSDLLDGTLKAVLIDVEDTSTGEKTVATVLLRQGNFALNMSPTLHPGLRPNGTALLSPPSPHRPEQFTWEVVAGEGSINGQTGLFTAPSTITQPYSVVKISHSDEFFDHFGYSIIHLSEHARQSQWHALDTFDFEVSTYPPTVYANGLQQAKVTVRVQPAGDGELSESEIESIKLVSAEQKIPLPEVGEDGVPEGNKWYYTESENIYERYPHPTLSQDDPPKRPKGMVVKEFFVQCHKVEDLRVAAMLRSDNYETFYSNPGSEGDADRKVINLHAVEPPEAGTSGGVLLTFGDKGPTRVDGDEDDEKDLTTLDYYYLKLLINQRQVPIKKIQFVGNSSMVKWESDTMLEDIHSITGYAIADDLNDKGKIILHTDEILKRRLLGQLNAPEETVRDEIPAGEVLFSLQRREYWRYDGYAKSDFDKALNVIVFDKYGNRHSVIIGFDGTNRNKLAIVGQS